ncbi:MAG: hypothetical protein K8R85_13700 [Bacteroidetes bacterium]|nr:hypothetical protein [Bacteroidota bacterium]
MKKILLFGAVVSAFSFASCKKDRTCTCVRTSTEPGYVSTTGITTYTKAKKGDARVACSSYSYLNATYTVTTTCELK